MMPDSQTLNSEPRPNIRIDSEGVWYYCGEPLARQEFLGLFYTVLNVQTDGYYLTTPAENIKIAVDDAPYAVVSVNMNTLGQVWCTLNTGSPIPINDDHAPRLSTENVIYVPLQTPKGAKVEARFTRNAYLQFAEYLVQHDERTFTINSFGQIYVLEVP